jgi:hypothetical protein
MLSTVACSYATPASTDIKLVTPAHFCLQSSPKVAVTANASTEAISLPHCSNEYPEAVQAMRTSRVCHDVWNTRCQIDLATR